MDKRITKATKLMNDARAIIKELEEERDKKYSELAQEQKLSSYGKLIMKEVCYLDDVSSDLGRSIGTLNRINLQP